MPQPEFEPLAPRVVTRNGAAAPVVAVDLSDRPASIEDRRSTIDRRAPLSSTDDPNEARRAKLGENENAESIRTAAIRLASIACASALRTAIARNPLFVARFVDEALERFPDRPATIFLHPTDAMVVGERPDATIEESPDLSRGDVIVEAWGKRIEGTIDGRAALLVRRAADA